MESNLILLKKNFLTLLFFIVSFQTLKSQCFADFSFTLGAGGTATFASTSSGTNTGTQYFWNVPGNPTTAVCTCTFSDNDIYPVTHSILNSSVSCYSSNTKTVGIVTAPCNYSLSFTTFTYQSGQVTFQSFYPGNSNQTYYFGDGTTGGNGIYAHTYTSSGVYNPTLVVTGYSNICTYSATNIVTLNSIIPCSITPSFSYSAGPNGQINFVSTSVGTSSNASFRWNFADTYYPIVGMAPSSITRTYTGNGTYPVVFTIFDTNPYFCTDSVTQLVTVSNVTCTANTLLSLQKLNSPANTWQALVTYPPGVTSVNWSWGDGSTSTGMFPSHTYSNTGYYNVSAVVSVSCGSVYTVNAFSYLGRYSGTASQILTINVVSNSATEIDMQIISNNDFQIYPNPNATDFWMNLSGIEVGKPASISIINCYGEVMYSENIIIESSSKNKHFVLPELMTGAYFVRISSDDNYARTLKMLIAK